MIDLAMDTAAPLFDLSSAPFDIITRILASISLRDRFICALVCKAWAKAATAATHSIILRDKGQDLSCLQTWLEKHGNQLKVLQLHECRGAALTALPCAQLQNLLLKGTALRHLGKLRVDTRVWSDIAAATKLTSVTLEWVKTDSQQADMVSALTALPDLEQLTWHNSTCEGQQGLTDSVLIQKLTKLTALHIDYVAEAEALEHLGGLTRLQDLSIAAAADWAAAGCPGLQELKALTRLKLSEGFDDIPASVSQFTALRQLDVDRATPTALNKLSALTELTQLGVYELVDLSFESPPLQLPGLQHLVVADEGFGALPMSFLASCTQLQVLTLVGINLSPGSLGASTMLQHLELDDCRVAAAGGDADPVSWQQVFPGPGQLPHLTLLKLNSLDPDLKQADIESVVACCSSLQVLQLNHLPDISAPALACLPGLTSLTLRLGSDQQCSSVAQLTGLRELRVTDPRELSVAGLVQLAALKELTCLGFEYASYSDKVHPAVWRQMSDKVPDCTYAITDKAPAGHPSDVPAQLLRACGVVDAADS